MAAPDLSYLDPAYLLRQTAKIFRGSLKDAPPSAAAPETTSSKAPVSTSALSSKELVLISGAAALGGAAVVAAVYATPLLMERYQLLCQCRCCACSAAQHPLEFLKRVLTKISSSLYVGKAKLLGDSSKTVSGSEVPPATCEDEQLHNNDSNGNWTCVQVSREDVEVQESSEVKPDPHSPTKRKEYLSWDDYFMSIAFLSAQRSKDPFRQVGACVVGQDDIILGIGYNGFPRGCSDDKLPWAKLSKDNDVLKTKYPYVCHAEMNAILNKNHASAAGQRLYTTMFPCNECAKLIIQAGISEVVFYMDKQGASNPQFAASHRLLTLANVKIRQHKPKSRSIILQFE